MNIAKYKTVYALIISLFILNINAQISVPEVNFKEMTPLSPQMRAFQTFGNIPVSNVTGVPDISIPLYTLVSGNIEIPITLKYHTHNVKPFDCNAGNLALGWVVDFGGVMNRTFKGGRDEELVEFINERTFDISSQADFNFLNQAVGESTVCSGFTDVFNYSLPTGESGRFFLKRKNHTGSFSERFDYFLFPNTESKIDMDLTGIWSNDIDSIRITDANGFVYLFGGSYKESVDGHNITGWMLNKVTDPFSGKQVDYTYTDFVNTDNNISNFYSTSSAIINENPKAKIGYGGFELNQILLPHGQCNCHFGENNCEYLDNNCYGAIKTEPSFSPNNGYTVQRINTLTNGTETITFYYNNKDKIDRIKITSGTETIKEITFNTSIESISSGTVVSETYRQLNSITITGINGSPVEEYSFEYSGYWKNLSSDYWGFYRFNNSNNGVTDLYGQKRTLDFELCDVPCRSNSRATLGNADLAANHGMTSNLISRITYPTKGYTVFEFEPGRYGASQCGGGPRIRSIKDVSGNGTSVKRNYYYENGYTNIDPNSSEAINAYLTTYKSIHDISLMSEIESLHDVVSTGEMHGGLYFTRTRILSNQLHQGLDLNVLYPKVEVVHENGEERYKEQFMYNALPENKVDYLDLYDGSVYSHIGTYLFNPASGKLLSRTVFDASGNIKQKEEYHYSVTTRATIKDLLIVDQLKYENGRNKLFGDTHSLIRDIGYDYLPNPIFAHKFYTINIPNIQLTQKTVRSFCDNDTLEYTEDYTFMPGSDVRIVSTTATQSDNSIVKIENNYIDSNTNNDMFQKNMINRVRETKYTKNSATIKISNEYNSQGLVTKVLSTQGIGTLPALETKVDYTYDAKGNVSSMLKSGDLTVYYIWGYDYTYLVAKIVNASLQEIESAVKTTFSISSLSDFSKQKIPGETKLQDGSLQQALPHAQVTTYTYKPLVGMTSKTDPRGVTTFYDYDGFGRLIEVYTENEQGGKQVIEKYDYKYATQ